MNLCYKLIKKYYGNKKAKRSGVPYINHIDEGLIILDAIDATSCAKDAYCIHPILQDDDSLNVMLPLVADVDYRTIITAMEYRNVANRGLSCYQVDNPDHIYLGPLKDVRDMLIADKVQNRKDFLLYHLDTHPKSIELDRYFRNWLRALKVTEAEYNHLVQKITASVNEYPLFGCVSLAVFNCTEYGRRLGREAVLKRFGKRGWQKVRARTKTGIMELFEHNQIPETELYAATVGKHAERYHSRRYRS